MDFLQPFFNNILDVFSRLGYVDYLVLTINLLLMYFARPIVRMVFHDESSGRVFLNRVQILRALNLLIIISFGYYHLYTQAGDKSIGLKIISVLLVIYLSYLFAYIASFFIRRKFGRIREVDGERRSIETYNSRLLSLFSGVFIFIIALISAIQILEFDSLLEAGGVIGFIGVFFALTQNAWAPDIFSGLIILNSGMMEEGDVIEIDNRIGMVFKTKMFHTEILNLVNNHRIMLKNAKLRELTIHNLSKFASARGLRENLHFKIAYEQDTVQIKSMFEKAFEEAVQNADINIEAQYPLEIGVFETGDHAVEWSIYYYTKDVKNIIKTRQRFRELILDLAKEYQISLSTPLTHDISYNSKNID